MVNYSSTSTPVGYGVISPGQLAPPSALLARWVDPQTNDFASMTVGMDPIDAQVLLALKVVRNSGPAVAEVGARYIDLKKIQPSTLTDIKAMTKKALSRLIANGDIRYKGVTYDLEDPGNQQIQARVQYVNLRAMDGQVREAIIPTPGGGS